MEHIYLIAVALIAAASLAVSINSGRALKQALMELCLEFQQQIDALSAKVGALERNAIAQSADSVLALSGEIAPAAEDAGAPCGAQLPEKITAETLAKIADTITSLLGRKVRIRSVRVVEQENAIVNAWAQQGRVVIQASHNLAQRGHES